MEANRPLGPWGPFDIESQRECLVITLGSTGMEAEPRRASMIRSKVRGGGSKWWGTVSGLAGGRGGGGGSDGALPGGKCRNGWRDCCLGPGVGVGRGRRDVGGKVRRGFWTDGAGATGGRCPECSWRWGVKLEEWVVSTPGAGGRIQRAENPNLSWRGKPRGSLSERAREAEGN